MVKDLRREDWLKAARLALLRGGVEAVRVEKLARALRVTKGSFYWHFTNRSALLEQLLCEWEREMADIMPRLGEGSQREQLLRFMDIVVERARLSERGEVPSDAAIFAWAAVSPEVAHRVNRAERRRLALLSKLIEQPDRVEVIYLAWLGFVARGQRVPSSRAAFPRIARTMVKVLLP